MIDVYLDVMLDQHVADLSWSLWLFSSGLFPLLSNAAMSVKPVLLGLYETYYLPLGKTLKPGLQGLLTGVLPGLEEGSEYYDRLDDITCVFLC